MQTRTITRVTRYHRDAMGRGRVYIGEAPVTVRSALRYKSRRGRVWDMVCLIAGVVLLVAVMAL